MESKKIQTAFDEVLRLQETKEGPILHVYKKTKINIKNGEIINKDLSPKQLAFLKQYLP